MSSSFGGSHTGGDNEDGQADESTRNEDGRAFEEEVLDVRETTEGTEVWRGQDEFENTDAEQNAFPEDGSEQEFHDMEDLDYAQLDRGDEDTISYADGVDPDDGPVTPVARSPQGSVLDSGSIPDDTPSIQGSLPSSPVRGASPTPRTPPSVSRKHSAALQPFERRFEARASPSRSPSSRAGSPAFLSPHSRQVSLSSHPSRISSDTGTDLGETPQAPWEVIRWTKLRKITGQAFSESGKRSFGRPTCLAVSALIAIGTSKGLILGFDYHQTLKIIIGPGTKATECGSVTAIAIAADYSTIASGHANGNIFTWEINRPSQPFLRIPPVDRSAYGQNPDGHVTNTAILHIGFLGTRHTALVSADAGGMAFSHLATRGLGPVTRTIKTSRLLGRYPSANPQVERGRKPSSVLAFSPLPLGNVEQATDNIGLTALLTPYLLVVVSTTPVAQTQHKASRPKEISPHSTLSGCLAWFPAVKLKNPASGADRGISDTKLVYCWSNVLTVLDVKILPGEEWDDSNKPPNLDFSPRSRWRAEEAIVAVQWLGRSVLGVLTVSQRLLIVEDGKLQVTDSIDLLHRHIYHQDLFSQQLKSVVETLNSSEPSLHGVIADAFYMSFKAYKGRTFLLGFNDLTVGTLSNWADRLMALMEIGDHIAAIKLATDYYAGSANNVTVGLPDDDGARHSKVKERLLAMVSASLNYTFSQHDEERESRLRELSIACFDACIGMHETDYLFGEVFDMFEEADEEHIFITTLEPYILDGEVTMLLPDVVKTLVAHFISENQATTLEELLCRLEPHSFDLDQVTTLCRQHSLYDALIYIWTHGIGDFVTPLIDLLGLIKMLQDGGDEEMLVEHPFFEPAMKVFPYLAYSLTSRNYPSGDPLDDSLAFHAKTELYGYLFSGTSLPWPQGSKKVFRTSDHAETQPAFPYLVLLLRFDMASFISMLNEAFEDPFLNGADDELDSNGNQLVNGSSGRPGHTMTRQHIVHILLDVVKPVDFGAERVVYLNMFIARSLPKYPGQLVLNGSLLDGILHQLCCPPSEGLREDCQLSVEYLLSAHHPTDMSSLIDDLKQAQFFRVLKSTYRGAMMYTELLETYFQDPKDKEDVFECVAFCLRSSSGLNQKQTQGVRSSITSHFQDLVDINAVATARTLATHARDLLQPALEALQDSHQQFILLRTVLEPSLLPKSDTSPKIALLQEDEKTPYSEQYVRLMCKHDPQHVADYVGSLPSGDLQLDNVLPAIEESGVIDAAVVLLARDGMARDAMDRLVTHLQSLQQALTGLVDAASHSPDAAATQEAAQDICEDVEKYTKVGIWLCQGQSAIIERRPRPRANNLSREVKEQDLELDEFLWLNLIDAVVQLTKSATSSLQYLDDHPSENTSDETSIDTTKLASLLRTNVQQTFTSLLAATIATPNHNNQKQQQQEQGTLNQPNKQQLTLQTKRPIPTNNNNNNTKGPNFLTILRAFLTRAAQTSPSLFDLRAVLSDVFAAYAFEEAVLSLSNDLLASDTFAEISDAHARRQRGWRPRGPVCEICKRRVWGAGLAGPGGENRRRRRRKALLGEADTNAPAAGGGGEVVWEAWTTREQEREAERVRKRVQRGGGEEARRQGKGKAKSPVFLPSSRSSTALALTPRSAGNESRSRTRSRDVSKGRKGGDGRFEGLGLGLHGDDMRDGQDRGEDDEEDEDEGEEEEEEDQEAKEKNLALVVFACRHVFHRVCLDEERHNSGRGNREGDDDVSDGGFGDYHRFPRRSPSGDYLGFDWERYRCTICATAAAGGAAGGGGAKT